MGKFLKIILLSLVILVLMVFCFFFIGKTKPAEEIKWGINFSQKQAKLLGLNWEEAYLGLLDDLKARRIKLITHWDYLEPERGGYDFNDLDWQIRETEKRGAEILLVIGMKTPRWPECHLPSWSVFLQKEEQQESVLRLIEEIVLRYKDSPSIWAWQVENEPFFPFGNCPWEDEKFVKREIELVKSLDVQQRPIVITDSGEWSLWIRSARLGDVVGVTTYRWVWNDDFRIYVHYPFPPVFYGRKAELIKELFNKKVIGVELQAEPWGPKLLYDSSLEEQEKTMNLRQFKENIEFARKTGIDEFYLWGAEWWYWLKEKENKPEIWNEARTLFSQ